MILLLLLLLYIRNIEQEVQTWPRGNGAGMLQLFLRI